MRIGIEMLAVQSPGSRNRGIGRYGSNLLAAMLARDPESQYLLYLHDGLAAAALPTAPNAAIRTLTPEPSRGEATMADAVDRLARLNPDGLDALVVLSPMETFARYLPPARPLNGLRVLAVVYDLIPTLFPDLYPGTGQYLERHLLRVRQYDALLAISEATRADYLRVLGLPAERVVTIGTASDGRFFVPDRSEPPPPVSRAAMDRLGIDRPFVFCLNGMDARKNLRGLVDAFALLPEELRHAHQLVVTCAMTPEQAAAERRHAAQAGVAEHLVLTGEIADEELRVLYQRCAAFAFPSLYEGFGLPLLEAMHCGAAVIAGDNSSQPEVVGDAGLLVNARDTGELAAQLGRILADPALARSLGERAAERARRFHWDDVAARALAALGRVVGRRGAARPRARIRVDRGHARRPRIALVSPLPPQGSGISDYAVHLARALGAFYAVDLYHDAGYRPHLGGAAGDFGCFDHRLFERRAAVLGYRGVVYQMGNYAPFHAFVYELMLRHPGVVTLHDFSLASFHEGYSRARGSLEHFVRELAHYSPERWGAMAVELDDWCDEDGGLHVACARRGVYLNRRLFERSAAVVVHSPWCLARVGELFPEHLGRTAVIPMGVVPVRAARREATRARFGLPPEALVVASFGILSRGKMNDETIEAFAPLAAADPAALLAFVGEDFEGGAARRTAARLGLADRVRFLGRQPDEAFADLIAAVDIGVNLRRPPTNGETSAALLELMQAGVPTIVTDVGTFADYPADVVRKIRWETDGVAGLARALRALADDAPARAALGRAAAAYVAGRHGWPGAAARYAEVIERCHAGRRAGASTFLGSGEP